MPERLQISKLQKMAERIAQWSSIFQTNCLIINTVRIRQKKITVIIMLWVWRAGPRKLCKRSEWSPLIYGLKADETSMVSANSLNLKHAWHGGNRKGKLILLAHNQCQKYAGFKLRNPRCRGASHRCISTGHCRSFGFCQGGLGASKVFEQLNDRNWLALLYNHSGCAEY